MDHSDRVEQFEIFLGSLEVGPASDVAGARALCSLEPGEAVFVLDSLIERGRTSARASQALAVVSRALAFAREHELPQEQRARIREVAAGAGRLEVCALFTTGAEAAGAPGAPAPRPAPEAPPGELTLGHKKSLARVADPDQMARLAMEGDARVVHEMLLNPRLTEPMVVRLVARRPAKLEVIFEVWRSARWSSRINVRRALSLNPYTPPEITLKLLPHLLAPDLKDIAADRAMSAEVRAVAAKLLRARQRR